MSGRPGRVLVVVCDVGPTHGVGHLMRSVALAEEFAARGFAVVFAADVDSVPFARAQLDARGFGSVAPFGGVEDHVAGLRALGASAVVVDSYHQPVELYDALTAAFPTLVLVDGDPQGRTARVLVDQNIGAEHDTWALPPGTIRLAGLDYALMRDEILERRPPGPDRAESRPPRIFAFFGGTDAFGAGPVVTRALVESRRPFALTVVAPTPWPEPVQPGDGQEIEVIAPTNALADHVLAADVVLSAAGTASWELLCLGAACAFVCVADNQVTSYDRIVDLGAVAGLGRLEELRRDLGPAARRLAALLDDAEARGRLRAQALRLVDGGGRARVLEHFAAFLD